MRSPGPNSPPALAAEIRRLIQTDEFRPGDHLGTVELAERFGVSRGPVREALRLLESLNLIRIVPRKGAFVIAPSDRETVEVMDIREVLFALLAQKCAASRGKDDLVKLKQNLSNLDALAKAQDTEPGVFMRATFQFVGAMYHASSSPRLAQFIKDLSEGGGALYGHLSMATRDMRIAEFKAYQALYLAIEDQDGDAAFAQARQMHMSGCQRARELYRLLPAPRANADEPIFRGRRRKRNVSTAT
jgi:DNA-binding GntR family transcriptional regulator